MVYNFKYEDCPLKTLTKHIRLVTIEPPEAGKSDARLVARISVHEITDEYTALSWVWGSPDAERDEPMILKVGDKELRFNIPGSLSSALRGLRSNSISQGRPLWVDYICINQNELERKDNEDFEKDFQVPLMSTIYGTAVSVFVWLGEDEADSIMALGFLKDRVLNLSKYEAVMSQRYVTEWEAFSRLIKKSWFSRRWIVQEVALARDAHVLCGTKSIPWPDFADGVTLFEALDRDGMLSKVKTADASTRHNPNVYGDVKATGAAHLARITNELFSHTEIRIEDAGTSDRRDSSAGRDSDGAVIPYQPQRLMSLEELLASLISFDASNPRDIVYALLSLAKDANPQAGRAMIVENERKLRSVLHAFGIDTKDLQSQPFRVDYQLPVSVVYVDCMKFIINRARITHPDSSLDIVTRPWAPQPDSGGDNGFESSQDTKRFCPARFKGVGVTRRPNYEEGEDFSSNIVPSWVKSVHGRPHALEQGDDPKMTRLNADPLVGRPGHPIYKASGRSSTPAAEPRFIRTKTTGHSDASQNEVLFHSMFVEGFELDTVLHCGDKGRHNAIPGNWMNLAGITIGQKRPEDTDPAWQAFWRTMVADRGVDGNQPARIFPRFTHLLLSMGHKREDKSLAQVPYLDICPEVAQWTKRVEAVICGRKLARSRDSKLLMLLPKRARPGDSIWIIPGSSVPWVLRKFPKTEQQIKEDKAGDEARDLEAEAARQQRLGSLVLGKLRSNVQRNEEKEVQPEDSISSQGTPGNQVSTPSSSSMSSAVWVNNERQALLAAATPLTQRIDAADLTPAPTVSKDASDKPSRKVIQQNDVFYEFIGECYVHGMMEGEALRYQFEKNLPWTAIELR